MAYDEIPGIAGSALRAAERAGLDIRASKSNGHESDGVLSWIISDRLDVLDALYVYWRPSKMSRGRTSVYRTSRTRKSRLVKLTASDVHAWIQIRREG